MKFIETIQAELGIEAKNNFCEMYAGDVYKTYANTRFKYLNRLQS